MDGCPPLGEGPARCRRSSARLHKHARAVTPAERGSSAGLAAALAASAAILGSLPALINTGARPVPLQPLPYSSSEGVETAAYNLAVFFSLLLAATVALYFLASRRRLVKLFSLFVWFALSTGILQFYAFLYYINGIVSERAAACAIAASPLLGASVAYLVYRERGDALLGILASLAGAMLAWLLPAATVVAILLSLAVYDYFMVNRGLLGRIIQRQLKMNQRPEGRGLLIPGFTVRVKSAALGTGDFVAYGAMLTFVAVRASAHGVLAAAILLLLSALMIYAGLRLTLSLIVRARGYGPALTLPTALALPLIAVALLC
jgi:hypothetical protein